jgi:hypothetical protein
MTPNEALMYAIEKRRVTKHFSDQAARIDDLEKRVNRLRYHSHGGSSWLAVGLAAVALIVAIVGAVR